MWPDVIQSLNDLRGEARVPLRGELLHLWMRKGAFPKDIRETGMACYSSPGWLGVPPDWSDRFDVVVCEEAEPAMATALIAAKPCGFVIYREAGRTVIYQHPGFPAAPDGK
jgi:hypothetical protein